MPQTQPTEQTTGTSPESVRRRRSLPSKRQEQALSRYVSDRTYRPDGKNKPEVGMLQTKPTDQKQDLPIVSVGGGDTSEQKPKTLICSVIINFFHRRKSLKVKQLGSPKIFLPRETTKPGSAR